MEHLPYSFCLSFSCGFKTTKLSADCSTLPPVTKYECVCLRPAWDLQTWLPAPWQGGQKMVEIPHIVGHAAILNPTAVVLTLLPFTSDHLSKERQKTTACTAVWELALTKTGKTVSLWVRLIVWFESLSRQGLIWSVYLLLFSSHVLSLTWVGRGHTDHGECGTSQLLQQRKQFAGMRMHFTPRPAEDYASLHSYVSI